MLQSRLLSERSPGVVSCVFREDAQTGESHGEGEEEEEEMASEEGAGVVFLTRTAGG